jgi:hypothetical protein
VTRRPGRLLSVIALVSTLAWASVSSAQSAAPAVNSGLLADPSQPIASLKDSTGSAYIPLDSWIYPAVLRLYSLGYVPTAYIGLRPWTRKTVLQMLRYSQEDILDGTGNEEAQEIFERVYEELKPDVPELQGGRGVFALDSMYV